MDTIDGKDIFFVEHNHQYRGGCEIGFLCHECTHPISAAAMITANCLFIVTDSLDGIPCRACGFVHTAGVLSNMLIFRHDEELGTLDRL